MSEYVSTMTKGHAYEYRRWVYRCPARYCYYARSVEHEGADVPHQCPQGNGPTKVSWTVYGPSLLEQTWTELDAVTARLMNPVLAADKVADSGYARGLAFTLSLFMMPHFRTPQDIAREAKKRYTERESGNTEYETPGLGTRKYEPPPGDNKYSSDSPEKQRVKRAAPAPKPEVALTAEQVTAINNAKVMFSSKELADMYGTTVKHIESL